MLLMRGGLCHTGTTSSNFGWAWQNQELAEAAGDCSIFMSSGDRINGNYAQAGGAVYSTDMKSLQINCSTGRPMPHQLLSCPSWSENTAISSPQAAGYGAVLAFPPSRMVLSQTAMLNFTSDGNPLVPLTVHVHDAAGTNVSSGTSSTRSVLCTMPGCCLRQAPDDL